MKSSATLPTLARVACVPALPHRKLPLAATRMTEDLMPLELLAKMGPETVVPADVYLVSDDAPTNAVINAGGGGFERSYVTLTQGIHVKPEDMTAETVAARFAEISDRTGEIVPDNGAAQTQVALGGAR